MKKSDIKLMSQIYIYWLLLAYLVFLSVGHFKFMDISDRTLLFLPVYVLIVTFIHFFILKKNNNVFDSNIISKTFFHVIYAAFVVPFFLTFSILAASVRLDLLTITTPNMFIIAGAVSIMASLAFYLGIKWKAIQN